MQTQDRRLAEMMKTARGITLLGLVAVAVTLPALEPIPVIDIALFAIAAVTLGLGVLGLVAAWSMRRAQGGSGGGNEKFPPTRQVPQVLLIQLHMPEAPAREQPPTQDTPSHDTPPLH